MSDLPYLDHLPALHVTRLAGHPVLAAPSGRTVGRAASGRLVGHTLKRRLAFGYATSVGRRLAARDGRAVPVADLIRDIGASPEALDAAVRGAGVLARTVGVVWPWPPRVQGDRLYLHWFDERGDAVAFSKVRRWPEELVARSVHERDLLAALHAQELLPPGVRAPTCLGYVGDGRCSYTTLSPAVGRFAHASRRHRARLLDVLRAILGRGARTRDSAGVIASWAAAEPWPSTADGLAARLSKPEISLRVGLVHGDLESKNVLVDRQGLLIVDWEHASTQGPSFTDVVTWVLSEERVTSMDELDRLVSTAVGKPVDRSDLAAAVLFASRVVGSPARGLLAAADSEW